MSEHQTRREVYDRLLRGEATSDEYVAAMRAERDEYAGIPWHTEEDVKLGVARMKAWTETQAEILADARWCDLTDDEWANLARVCLGMVPR